MKLTKKQLALLKANITVILTTASLAGKPNAAFMEVNKIEDGKKLIITDNHMKVGNVNIKKNKRVCLLAYRPNYSQVLKISGEAKYYASGPYFNYVKKSRDNIGYRPKGAVVVIIKKVEEIC
jgi:uncharacterized pyridoxamine 5'-phosphate oxidase family protein